MKSSEKFFGARKLWVFREQSAWYGGVKYGRGFLGWLYRTGEFINCVFCCCSYLRENFISGGFHLPQTVDRLWVFIQVDLKKKETISSEFSSYHFPCQCYEVKRFYNPQSFLDTLEGLCLDLPKSRAQIVSRALSASGRSFMFSAAKANKRARARGQPT